jgi:hypothetical protein
MSVPATQPTTAEHEREIPQDPSSRRTRVPHLTFNKHNENQQVLPNLFARSISMSV